MKKGLILLVVLFSYLNANAESVTEPRVSAEPPPEATTCLKISQKLMESYNTLYNIDARPLAFDNYKLFRDATQTVHDQAAELMDFCNNKTESTLYKIKDLAWTSAQASYEDLCSISGDHSVLLNEFEQTSIRQCYSENYTLCAVKEKARLFNLKSTRNPNLTWSCTAQLDLVLSVKK